MNEKLFAQLLQDNINNHSIKRSLYTKYFDYYRGDHDIKNRPKTGKGKPNNKLVFNFAELIVDTNHSYLFSKPYSVDMKEENSNFFKRFFKKAAGPTTSEEFIEDIQTVYFDNDEAAVTSKHGKTSAIAGVSVEVHYIDKKGRIRFKNGDPREWFSFVYDKEEYVVRNYKTSQYVPVNNSYELKEVEKCEVYTDETISLWENSDKGWQEVAEHPHFYEEIPVIFFYNRELQEEKDSTSDLKNVIVLNDAYNNMTSSVTNTLEYNGDPYMIFKGATLDEDMIANMAETRIIEIDDEDDIDFLQWDHTTEAYEKMLDRLERQLFVLSFTPDLFSKEGLSSDSGVSLKMKFIGADLKAQQKETSFKSGIKKRLRLLAKQLELKSNKPYFSSGVYRNVEITFNRSVPQNLKETAEIVQALAGSISDETRLKLLPFVDNSKDEMERRDKEQDLFSDPFEDRNRNENNE